MTDTNLNPEQVARLDAAISRVPGYGVPSVATQQHLLDDALTSDNIDEVKARLRHVWDHYQTLEFALVNYDFNATAFREGVAENGIADLVDVDPYTVSAVVYGTNILLASYDASHQVETLAMITGGDPSDLLREVFSEDGLEFDDPDRAVADEEVAQ